jgi:hypothetical protein
MSALYPCDPWPIDPVCCPGWPPDEEDWDEAHFEAQWLATVELWRAVAGVIGLCRTTEMPCMDQCVARPLGSYWMRPYRDDTGAWFNSKCGCRDTCSCTQLCTVTLQGPVYEIESVTVDGVALETDEWKLLTNNRLARCGGCWPACQNYCTEEGLVVTYLRGTPPGLDAIRAVSLLACRKLQECPPGGGGDCGQLPSGVTSINREGLSMQLNSTIGSSDDDGIVITGIARVDRWIASINPYGVTSRPSVWSPDVDTPQIWRTGPVVVP